MATIYIQCPWCHRLTTTRKAGSHQRACRFRPSNCGVQPIAEAVGCESVTAKFKAVRQPAAVDVCVGENVGYTDGVIVDL
mgnify:CR=1 FL=1